MVVTQMITITSVTHVITVNICKVKVFRDDMISRYFPEIAQSICPIMPTSLSKAFVTGVFGDNVALV
jgi:hypothetical protein